MEKVSNIDNMNCEQLAHFIVNTQKLELQCQIIGTINANQYKRLTSRRKFELMLNTITQMPDDILNSYIEGMTT